FRAARRLWARIMRERFGARDPRSQTLRFHAQTAGSMLTAQQPENNIVRVTVQALAAVLGGCQSLHTHARDEALSLPAERAVRIALRTQQILAHESGVADTVDPLGGSYAVERLTRDIEAAAEAYITRIDAQGGAVQAIGFMQREIQEAAYRWQREVEDKRRVVVGVNEFVTDHEPPAVRFSVDPGVSAALAERVAAMVAGLAAAGAADRSGATFTLMADDFIQAFQPVEGIVVSLDGDEIFLDIGATRGAQVGQEYTIFRKGAPFLHPLTGRPLGRYEDVLGWAQVKRVQPEFAIAAFVRAPDKPTPQPEDGARITRGRIKIAVAPVLDMPATGADLRRVPY